MFFVLPVLAQQVPAPIPVPSWSFLQDEAVSVLEAQGFPAGLTPSFARSKIRAYALGRLLQIIGKSAAQRSAAEQAAYDYLRSSVQANRAAIANNAVEFWNSIAAGDPCFSGGNPTSGIYVPPGALVSLFCSLFQNQKPNQREVYRGQGAAEVYAELLSSNGAVELAAVLDDVDWFTGRAVTADGPLFAADSPAEKDFQAALNVFRFIRGKEQTAFLLSLINPSPAPVNVIRTLLVLGSTVWDVADFTVIGNDLRAAAAAAGTANPNLEGIIGGELTELVLVFMGRVLVPELAGVAFSQPVSRACGFNSKFSCAYWNIREADPDFVAERHAGQSLPPPEPGSYFALKRESTSAWQPAPDLSPLTIDGSSIRPWALALRGDAANVNGEIGGSSTRRQEPLPAGVDNPNELRLPKTSGLSAFAAGGLLVQLPVDAGVAKPAEWKYGTTLKYQDWRGEWWKALFVNGTFLHLRESSVLPGYAQVGGFVQQDGGLVIQDGTYTDSYTYGKAWTSFRSSAPGVNPVRDPGKVDGRCILLSRDFDHPRLKVGDRIEIGGQQRTITRKVNCEGVDLNNTGALIDLFIDQLWCDDGNKGFEPLAPETLDWGRTALIVDPPLASLVGDYGPSDWFVIRSLEEIDTCARTTTGLASFFCGVPVNFDYDRRDLRHCPKFGNPIVGDSSLADRSFREDVFDDGLWRNEFAAMDCFYSPLVRYRSSAGDNDGTANGYIVDPGAPALRVAGPDHFRHVVHLRHRRQATVAHSGGGETIGWCLRRAGVDCERPGAGCAAVGSGDGGGDRAGVDDNHLQRWQPRNLRLYGERHHADQGDRAAGVCRARDRLQLRLGDHRRNALQRVPARAGPDGKS